MCLFEGGGRVQRGAGGESLGHHFLAVLLHGEICGRCKQKFKRSGYSGREGKSSGRGADIVYTHGCAAQKR